MKVFVCRCWVGEDCKFPIPQISGCVHWPLHCPYEVCFLLLLFIYLGGGEWRFRFRPMQMFRFLHKKLPCLVLIIKRNCTSLNSFLYSLFEPVAVSFLLRYLIYYFICCIVVNCNRVWYVYIAYEQHGFSITLVMVIRRRTFCDEYCLPALL
jgi:hypothetical protein